MAAFNKSEYCVALMLGWQLSARLTPQQICNLVTVWGVYALFEVIAMYEKRIL